MPKPRRIPRRRSHPRPRADLLIGRSSDCDLILDSWTVSRRHARIRRDGDRWMLEDLGSTNGTGLNGHPVISPVVLRDGDLITFGIVALRFTPLGERHLV